MVVLGTLWLIYMGLCCCFACTNNHTQSDYKSVSAILICESLGFQRIWLILWMRELTQRSMLLWAVYHWRWSLQLKYWSFLLSQETTANGGGVLCCFISYLHKYLHHLLVCKHISVSYYWTYTACYITTCLYLLENCGVWACTARYRAASKHYFRYRLPITIF